METLGSAGDHPSNQAAHVAEWRGAVSSPGSPDTARRLRRIPIAKRDAILSQETAVAVKGQ